MKLSRVLKVLLSVLGLTAALASIASASSETYLPRHGVNFSTGNKFLQQDDVALAGPVATLRFSRSYNSQSTDTSILGYGWTFALNDQLTFDNTLAIYKQSDGHIIRLVSSETDTWITQVGRNMVLTKTSTGYTLTEPNNIKRFFNNSGLLIEKRDRNNNSITLSYSGTTLTTIADGFGRVLTLQYNANAMLATLLSPIGTFTYGYDANNNLISVTKPDGGILRYLYEDTNDAHNLTGVLDENNVRTQTIGYNSLDRVISSALINGSEAITIDYQSGYKRVVTNSLEVVTTYQLQVLQGVAKIASMTGPSCSGSCGGSSTTSYVYDSRLQATEATDAKSVTTTYTYDEAGNQTNVTKAANTPLASTTTKTYDPVTNQVLTITKPSIANPGQNTVATMTYDTKGNLLNQQQNGFSGTTAISSLTKYTYNTLGQILTIDGPRTDVNDVVTFAYYANTTAQGNNRGNLKTVKNGLGQTTTYSNYNAFGQARTISDPNSIVTTRVYNTNGLLLSSTTAGLATSYTYDTTGKLLTITLPGTRVISYSYTLAGQVATITDNQSNSIAYTYDSEGRRTAEEVHDPQNVLTRSTGYGYDEYGRLNMITFPGSVQETAGYDLVGNLVSTINGTAMETNYQYDSLNRLLAVTEAGDAVASYAYDAQGNIATVTDAKNKVTGFIADDLGRKTQRTAPDTGATNSSYDPAGNLLTFTDGKGQSTTLSYDALNRPIKQTYAGTGDILFAYDQGTKAIGRLSKITDREGTDTFTYNTTGRIATETRVIGSKSHAITYSWNSTTGDLTGMTYPSGLSVTYTRDTNGQVSAIKINTATVVSAVTRLPFGPLKTATLGSVNLTKEYDQRYNVSRIHAGTLDYVYSRDAGGYVTGITGLQVPAASNDTVDYSYNPANNQQTGATGLSPKTCTYDANGNMVSNGIFTFVNDGLNRLVQVQQQSTIVATYGYDSSNRRIRKTVGTTITHYLYDLNNHLIAERLANGTALREYIYLDGEPIALKEYQTNPGLYYYINDHLGTPQQLVTATGTVVWQAAYQPYGQAQVTVATVKNNLRFPGQYFDAETGLHYNWNRYYDSDTGRYLCADPIGLAGGMNLYAYVSGNPINWADPMGLVRTCIGKARVLEGNSDHIGSAGGLSSTNTPTIINARSAAVIPSQWGGGKSTLRNSYTSISGRTSDGTLLFDNVADVVGGQSPDPTMNVRDWLIANNPNSLIIELPGGQDLGTIGVKITIPDEMACPKGTSEMIKQPPCATNN